MDFVSVTQGFTELTVLIRHVQDPCAATMTVTFSTALIAASIAQKESKFHVNLMPMKTSSRELKKAFAMGLVRVSALLHTSERTAAFWTARTTAASTVTAASSSLNQDVSAKMDSPESTASI